MLLNNAIICYYICSSAIFSTINATWIGLGLNLGLCGGEGLMFNHLRHAKLYQVSKNMLYTNPLNDYTNIINLLYITE